MTGLVVEIFVSVKLLYIVCMFVASRPAVHVSVQTRRIADIQLFRQKRDYVLRNLDGLDEKRSQKSHCAELDCKAQSVVVTASF